PASSFAGVGAAAVVDVEDGKCSRVRPAVGGATACSVRATAAEKSLTGQRPDTGSIASAASKVADAIAEPMGDLYASGEYRKHLATVLARRALTTAVAGARGQPVGVTCVRTPLCHPSARRRGAALRPSR